MDRRQYLLAAGTALSTVSTGCLGLGGSEDSGPSEPYIVQSGVSVETSPQIRVSVPVRNPTESTVTRKIWIRLNDKDGNVLDTDSKRASVNPTTEEEAPPAIPFIFDRVAYSGTDVDTNNVEAVLTQPDADSPF